MSYKNSWGKINLGSVANDLPAAGSYTATISDAVVHDKYPVALWLSVSFTLEDRPGVIAKDMACIMADATGPHATRVAEGRRFLNRLSTATGISLDGVDADSIPALLIGKRLTVTAAHKLRDGVPDLVVRGIGPAPRDQ
jgi:hypothetical protein